MSLGDVLEGLLEFLFSGGEFGGLEEDLSLEVGEF